MSSRSRVRFSASFSDTQPGAALLAQAGEALYGHRWVLPLGQALNIPDGTFQNLKTGKVQIPTMLWSEILGLVKAKERELRLAGNVLKSLPLAGDDDTEEERGQ